MIPAEVIEAAAIAAHVDKLTGVRWGDLADWKRSNARRAARVAIEAAIAAWKLDGRAFASGGELERQPWPPSPR